MTQIFFEINFWFSFFVSLSRLPGSDSCVQCQRQDNHVQPESGSARIDSPKERPLQVRRSQRSWRRVQQPGAADCPLHSRLPLPVEEHSRSRARRFSEPVVLRRCPAASHQIQVYIHTAELGETRAHKCLTCSCS